MRPKVRSQASAPRNRLISTSLSARQRHELTRSKASQALRELDRTGAPVTFQTVAQQASVSRSWLYTQPDIRAEIDRLGTTARLATEPSVPARQRSSEASCNAASKLPTAATISSPGRTPGSADNSPKRSAACD
ncbi:DUF6262 family protein [Nonomuraea rosea]|uniref:DUF6262 family protein n=1 Tax=Nonomuraea rosea TaxID=638574 RepID=UPI0031EC0E69